MLTAPEHAENAAGATPTGVVLAAPDPLAAMQRLATAWRRHLGAQVIGVTGSTGKTSTKDLLLAVLSPHRRTVASRANFNTEIGLPLEILAARCVFYAGLGCGLAALVVAIDCPAALGRAFFWLALLVTTLGALGIGLTIASALGDGVQGDKR